MIERPFNHHHDERDFAEVTRALEEASGRPLGHPHRGMCLAAFRRRPAGVQRVAQEALTDSDGRNPLGLFIWRVRHGWHELDPVPDPRTAAPPPRRRPAECFFCEKWSDDATYAKGQWWCPDHLEEAA